MAVPAVTRVPVVLVVRAVTRGPEVPTPRLRPIGSTVVLAVLAAQRGLRVRVQRVRPVRMARRCCVTVLMVALVVRAAMVAMVVSGVWAARRPITAPTVRRVLWARRLVARLVVQAVPAVLVFGRAGGLMAVPGVTVVPVVRVVRAVTPVPGLMPPMAVLVVAVA